MYSLLTRGFVMTHLNETQNKSLFQRWYIRSASCLKGKCRTQISRSLLAMLTNMTQLHQYPKSITSGMKSMRTSGFRSITTSEETFTLHAKYDRARETQCKKETTKVHKKWVCWELWRWRMEWKRTATIQWVVSNSGWRQERSKAQTVKGIFSHRFVGKSMARLHLQLNQMIMTVSMIYSMELLPFERIVNCEASRCSSIHFVMHEKDLNFPIPFAFSTREYRRGGMYNVCGSAVSGHVPQV
jgi:hypothetical protein